MEATSVYTFSFVAYCSYEPGRSGKSAPLHPRSIVNTPTQDKVNVWRALNAFTKLQFLVNAAFS